MKIGTLQDFLCDGPHVRPPHTRGTVELLFD